MHWNLVEEALGQAFQSATGLPFRWKGRTDQLLTPPWGELNLSAPQAIGKDEKRKHFIPDVATPEGQVPKDLGITLCGNRKLIWSVKVVNFAHGSLAAGKSHASWHYLEDLRTRLYAESIRAPLRAVNLAISSIGPTTEIPLKLANRQVSSSALDVVVLCAVNLEDCPITYIETFEISTDFKKPNGESLPDSAQLNDEEIP